MFTDAGHRKLKKEVRDYARGIWEEAAERGEEGPVIVPTTDEHGRRLDFLSPSHVITLENINTHERNLYEARRHNI